MNTEMPKAAAMELKDGLTVMSMPSVNMGGTLGIVLGYIVSAIANQVLPMFTDGMDVTI